MKVLADDEVLGDAPEGFGIGNLQGLFAVFLRQLVRGLRMGGKDFAFHVVGQLDAGGLQDVDLREVFLVGPFGEKGGVAASGEHVLLLQLGFLACDVVAGE